MRKNVLLWASVGTLSALSLNEMFYLGMTTMAVVMSALTALVGMVVAFLLIENLPPE